jgi:CheY-like chemotaxis protein
MPTKLLLADDSATIHKVISLTFAAEDVQIETVSDGSQALEKVRAGKPDIVLADVFMPILSGYELCAAIKSDPDLGLTPVILLVGSFEPFDEDEATRVQCDAYLTKPFDTSELIKIVRHLVEQHKAARSAYESGARISPDALISAAQSEQGTISEGLVSKRTRESFLGTGRILDLFVSPEKAADSPLMQLKDAAVKETGVASAAPAPPCSIASAGEPTGTSAQALSDETIDRIVEKVVRRMSDKVVREIAWEVVPEVSEIMIRHYIDELRPKRA